MKLTKKTAIVFTAALLVLAPTAAIVYAHSSGMGIGKGRWSGGTHNMMGTGTHNFNGTFRMNVVPMLMGHGFALNPSDKSEYHVLDVTAMKVSNASQSQTRAYLRFAGQPYGLTITGYTNQSLTGDIMTVPQYGTSQTGFTPAPAGTISLSISNYEGQMLATGSININGTNYNVLLSSPVMHSGGEQRNFSGMHNFNGTFKPHNWTMKQ